MTLTEYAVIAGGFMLSYWAVSSFMSSGDKAKDTEHASTPEHEFGREQNHCRAETPPPGKEERIQDTWHRILEVEPTANLEEIKQAYKEKIRQYHPDKVTSLAVEFQQMAELKSKEINVAYDYAMKHKGLF